MLSPWQCGKRNLCLNKKLHFSQNVWVKLILQKSVSFALWQTSVKPKFSIHPIADKNRRKEKKEFRGDFEIKCIWKMFFEKKKKQQVDWSLRGNKPYKIPCLPLVSFSLSIADPWSSFLTLRVYSPVTFHFCVWTLPVDSGDKKHLFRSLVNFSLPFWLSLLPSFLENCTLNLSPDLHVSLGTCHCTPDSSVDSVGRASFSFPSTQSTCMHLLQVTSLAGQASRVLLCMEDDNSS